MRFGVSRDSELMATVQDCSNWDMALITGQTTTLLNLSAEENNTKCCTPLHRHCCLSSQTQQLYDYMECVCTISSWKK